jgi:hypothetical protein
LGECDSPEIRHAATPLPAPDHGAREKVIDASVLIGIAIADAKGRIPYQVAKANGYAIHFDEAFAEVLAALPTMPNAERALSGAGEAVPDFWMALRDDNESMGIGATRQAALDDAAKHGQANEVEQVVAAFTNWPTHPAPAARVTEAQIALGATALAGMAFYLAQPNRGSEFSFVDEHRMEFAKAVLTAALSARTGGTE